MTNLTVGQSVVVRHLDALFLHGTWNIVTSNIQREWVEAAVVLAVAKIAGC